jgi:hypothetical protein
MAEDLHIFPQNTNGEQCLALFANKRVNKSDLPAVIFLVFGVFINQWSFLRGLQTADPTTSALIFAIKPILTGF